MPKWIQIVMCVLASILVAVWIVALGFEIFGYKGKKVEDMHLEDQGEETVIVNNTKSISDCTPTESLYILTGKIHQISYNATVSGEVVALGGLYKQTVNGEKYYQDNKGMYISKATSSFVKVGKKIYIDQLNNVKVIDAKDVKKDTWKDETDSYTLSEYLSEYGVDFRELTNYVLNDETILTAQLIDEGNGNYTYKYTLDTEKATIGYRINMAKMGGLNTVPEFQSCEMTVVMNENFEPVSITCVDSYKVAMLGGLNCTSTLTTTFSNINEQIEFPDLTIFQ